MSTLTTEAGLIIRNDLVRLARAQKKDPKLRKMVLILSSSGFVIGISLILLKSYVFQSNLLIDNIGIAFALVSSVFFCTFLLSFGIKDKAEIDEVIEEIKKKQSEFQNKTDDEISVLDVINNNLNQLSEYYVINKIQSKSSYSFSVFTITLGFIFIICSFIYYIVNGEVNSVTFMSGVAGILAEFIGATSMVLYKESNTNVDSFHNQLNKLQNMMLAIEISKTLPEDEQKIEKSKIISALINS